MAQRVFRNCSLVTSIDLKNSSNTEVASHAYTFNALLNVLTRTDDGVCTTFGYDEIDQLLSEFRTGYSASYTYDANGNRLSKTLNGVTQTYVNDAGDKLTGVWQGLSQVKSFTYDAAGRTTSITEGGVTKSFTYDYDDRITKIAYTGGATNFFGYNGLGARVSKSDSGGSFTYTRNGAAAASPVLADGYANYTECISERRSGTTKFHSDARQQFTTQINVFGNVTASRQYDAFGNITSSSGIWSGPFGYCGSFGAELDPDSGTFQSGRFTYDPSIGRYLTPRGVGRSRYTARRPNLSVPIGQIDGGHPRIWRQLWKWPGEEGKRLRARYGRDGHFRERIQRGIEGRKQPGPDGRHNEDDQITPDDIDEAIREADEKSEEPWRNERGRNNYTRLRPRIERIMEDGSPGLAFDPGPFRPEPPTEEGPNWTPWIVGGATIIVCGAVIIATGGVDAPLVIGGAARLLGGAAVAGAA